MFGRPVHHDGRTLVDVRRFRRENIGFVIQHQNLVPFLSARDNVALVLDLAGAPRREARRRALELLTELGVGHRAHDLPARLSGGEQQRVAIARALANAPRLVLVDEPAAALDTERGAQVMAQLRRITRERAAAVITVTHDERMLSGFDSVYRIRDGRMETAATP
jgi:putative ABC transport system ATP-binding protein